METPLNDRIKSLRQEEITLRAELESLEKYIRPTQQRIYKLSDRIWTIAEEKLDLQEQAILEKKEATKKEDRLSRELAIFAKQYGEVARDALLEILEKKEN